MSEKIGLAEVVGIVDHFTKQLKTSGYSRKQARDFIVNGVVGYKRKIERCRKSGKPLYRTAKQTLKGRVKKKLLEKTTWFKSKKKDDTEMNGGEEKDGKRMRQKDRIKKDKHEKKIDPEKPETVKAVLYVPQTAGSKLAKALREKEAILEGLTGYRLKIVERSGTPLERQLHKSNHWSGQDCEREKCLLCETKSKSEKKSTQSCSKRNLIYQTWCNDCKVKDEKEISGDENKKVALYTYHPAP